METDLESNTVSIESKFRSEGVSSLGGFHPFELHVFEQWSGF
jgi:hypothetical protein